MATVSQPGLNPTNKLSAATVGAALVSVVGLLLKNLAPEWYDAEVLLTISPVVVFALGYVIKDRPNY